MFRYGVDSKDNYSLAFMYQYFSMDYDALNEEFSYPIDSATNQPAEMLPNGLLLDHLRAPYQFQQLPAESQPKWLSYRALEVKENWRRLVEIATDERVWILIESYLRLCMSKLKRLSRQKKLLFQMV